MRLTLIIMSGYGNMIMRNGIIQQHLSRGVSGRGERGSGNH